jgi:hypothetical protein
VAVWISDLRDFRLLSAVLRWQQAALIPRVYFGEPIVYQPAALPFAFE